MKKKDSAIWRLMEVIHKSPNGLRVDDFPSDLSSKKYKDLRPLLRRNAMCVTKVGGRNVYTVSADQWTKYQSETPRRNLSITAAEKVKPEAKPSRAQALYQLASHPQGTDCNSFPDKSVSAASVSMSLARLKEEGILFRLELGGRQAPRYFASQALADASGLRYKQPKRRQAGSEIPATFRLLNQPIAHEVTQAKKKKAWEDAEMTVPDHVQIQRYPTPPGRYEVTGPVVGGFLSEWRTLRAA